MERSDHISGGGVRAYGRSTDKQHQAVSQLFSGCTGDLAPSFKTESAIGELVSSSTIEIAIGEVVLSVKEEHRQAVKRGDPKNGIAVHVQKDQPLHQLGRRHSPKKSRRVLAEEPSRSGKPPRT